MFSAMENSDVAAVQTLLSVVPAAVHCVTSETQTPLSLAVNNSHEELVSILLSHNADVNAFVGDGKQQGGGTETLLCKAVQKGHIGIVQALLDAGADPTKSHTVSGRSPLHMACWLGLIEVVQALLMTARERGLLRPPALSDKEPIYLLAVLFCPDTTTTYCTLYTNSPGVRCAGEGRRGQPTTACLCFRGSFRDPQGPAVKLSGRRLCGQRQKW